jgi:hypothetical protein
MRTLAGVAVCKEYDKVKRMRECGSVQMAPKR